MKSQQCPGDILMLTAAVRDLHMAYPGRFETDVRTSSASIWENSELLTPLDEEEPDVEVLDMHYPLIHQSNQRPYHFVHAYARYLEGQLELQIPLTKFHGDIWLSEQEKDTPPVFPGQEVPESYWIIIAGGKYDFTAKWWNPDSYQAVVDHYRGRVHFVQCGAENHWHPRLAGVTDLVGRTGLRQFIRLMYRAEGVVCPVTFAMHLAAAVETPPGRPKNRAAVVIAGGREPASWEAYPHHQFINANGTLACCANGGCWKSRCQPVGDADSKDRNNLCARPVTIGPQLQIPQCMDLIRPQDVIRRIEMYYEGGVLPYAQDRPQETEPPRVDPIMPSREPRSPGALPKERLMNILIKFRHGLGDAVQLTAVLRHLAHYHQDWTVDVAALLGKHSAFHGLCRKVFVLDEDVIEGASYERVYDLDWLESRTIYPNWPSTKTTRSLVESFRLRPIPALCRYEIQRGDRAERLARAYLEEICERKPDQQGRYPAVLIHYQGNTSADRKNLPEDAVRPTCEAVLDQGRVPVILDWDWRSSLVDGIRIHNPDANHPIWDGTGMGSAEILAALIEASSLMIGIDSGPLHVAGATSTPTVGVWTRNHPLNFFDLADNVLHLVPEHDRGTGQHGRVEFFLANYRAGVYRDLPADLPALVAALLGGESPESLPQRSALTIEGCLDQ